MCFKKFSFTNLEKQLEEVSTDVGKIEFISKEVTKCKNTIQDVKYEAANFDTMEIKLNVKAARKEIALIELVNSDRRLRRDATRKLMKLCAKKLINEFSDYLERVEVLLTHYKTKLEARNSWNECSTNEKNIVCKNETNKRILWKHGKEKLLKLFECLYENEIIPKYSSEEILVHFKDEKHVPFCRDYSFYKKLSWYDSDNSFSIFVDELAKRGVINDDNKYKVFERHFLNKKGIPFKDLAQKKNYTKNYTQTGNLIGKILDSICISVIIFFWAHPFLNDFMFEEITETLSYFI